MSPVMRDVSPDTEVITEEDLEKALYSINMRLRSQQEDKQVSRDLCEQRHILLSLVEPYCIMEKPGGFPVQRLELSVLDSDPAIMALYQGLVCGGTEDYLEVEDPSREQLLYYRGYFAGNGFFRAPILRPERDPYMTSLPHYFQGRWYPYNAERGDGSGSPYLMPFLPDSEILSMVRHIQDGAFIFYPKLRSKAAERRKAAACLRMSMDRRAYYDTRRGIFIEKYVRAYRDFIFHCMQAEAYSARLYPVKPPDGIDADLQEYFDHTLLPLWKQIENLPPEDVPSRLKRKLKKAAEHLKDKARDPAPYSDRAWQKEILADSILRFAGKPVTARMLVQAYPDVQFYIKKAEAKNRQGSVQQLLAALPPDLRGM